MSDVLFEVVFIINTILLAITLFTICTLKKCLKEIQSTLNYIAGVEGPSESEEDELQVAIEKRDREFAERIEKIKNELAAGAAVYDAGYGTPAMELHPNVHNLPHDAVYEEVEPKIEVSI